MDAISSGLGIGHELLKLTNDIMTKSQAERIDEVLKKAQKDVDEFKQALLDRNPIRCQLLIDSLRGGLKVSVSEAEFTKLASNRNISKGIEDYDLLGFYAVMRDRDLLLEKIEILQTSNK